MPLMIKRFCLQIPDPDTGYNDQLVTQSLNCTSEIGPLQNKMHIDASLWTKTLTTWSKKKNVRD